MKGHFYKSVFLMRKAHRLDILCTYCTYCTFALIVSTEKLFCTYRNVLLAPRGFTHRDQRSDLARLVDVDNV